MPTSWSAISGPSDNWSDIEYQGNLLDAPVITLEDFHDGDDVVIIDSGLLDIQERLKWAEITGPSTSWSDVT